MIMINMAMQAIGKTLSEPQISISAYYSIVIVRIVALCSVTRYRIVRWGHIWELRRKAG